MDMTNSTSLEDDSFRRILLCLSGDVKDIANFACVCKSFRDLAAEEAVWAAACDAWARQHSRSEFDVLAAQKALRMRGARALYQALALLQGDALGLWRSLDEQPHGQLLRVALEDGAVVGRALPAAVAATEHERVAAGLPPPPLETVFSLRFEERGGRVRAVAGCSGGARGLGEGESASTVVSRGGGLLQLLAARAEAPAAPANGWWRRLWAGRGAAGEGGWQVLRSWERIECAEPSSALAESDAPRCGLFTAQYGPHGAEIIQLRSAGAAAAGAAPPLPDPTRARGVLHPLGLERPRLEGLKITGDPNVPAGRLTFVADCCAADGQGVGGAGGGEWGQWDEADQRQIVSFTRHGPQLVQLGADGRDPSRRLRCCGQINRHPGTWDPEWVRSTFVFYHPGAVATATGAPVSFSVLWEDEGEAFRHIIDFSPVPSIGAEPAWPTAAANEQRDGDVCPPSSLA